jgi:NAD+ synthase (glutamine-hydrolysing)
VFRSGKLLAAIPKTYLPNYGEFSETRWFCSAIEMQTDNIILCNQKIPFGNIILESGFRFAVEIGADLLATVPPSCAQSVAGADIIFNPSADNEVLGKYAYLQQTVLQQSARCLSGYVLASSGWGESSTDMFFAGKAFIAEKGRMLAEAERFSFKEQLIISEIDVERLQAERMRCSDVQMFRCSDIQIIRCSDIQISRCSYISDIQHSTFNIQHRKIDKHPFIPSDSEMSERCYEALSIQAGGLAKRLAHTGINKVVLGISGGLDSTLALLVCVNAFDKLGIDRKNISGITMPGFGTTGRTYQNALDLMAQLGISSREINIKAACLQHFADIGHSPDIHDTTYENVQARERTQILMDIANKTGALVVGTGDLSELALGWATFNGDHISMYGVNAGVPKTFVRCLVQWAATQVDDTTAKTLTDILSTPVSPELLPTDDAGNSHQQTEDIVGPYELHDFFLYYMIRFGFSREKIRFLALQAFAGDYTEEVIDKWLNTFMRRFYSQQFKRSCMPDGVMIGSVGLSPRGSWRMPSDAVMPE